MLVLFTYGGIAQHDHDRPEASASHTEHNHLGAEHDDHHFASDHDNH
jgi:hypothetical protein